MESEPSKVPEVNMGVGNNLIISDTKRIEAERFKRRAEMNALRAQKQKSQHKKQNWKTFLPKRQGPQTLITQHQGRKTVVAKLTGQILYNQLEADIKNEVHRKVNSSPDQAQMFHCYK
ncbi:hypothetical protein JTB14_011523 [Gonioctena quinquepunctata]|nr:hypothetical protein JTB14_011523 [Gonioctena quinquepunctata]